MASRNEDDPMSGLLSGLSGIDANLFRKNESLAAAKKRAVSFSSAQPVGGKHQPGQISPSMVGQGLAHKPSPTGPRGMATATSFSSSARPFSSASHPPTSQPQGVNPSVHSQKLSAGGRDPFLASQLDAFSGLDITKPRSMRQMQQAKVTPSVDPVVSQPVVVPKQVPAPSAAGLNDFQLHDDLDLVFNQPSTELGGGSNAASSGSLVDLGFGMPETQPSPAPSSNSPIVDWLGVEEISSATKPHTTPVQASSGDPLDIFGEPQSQPAETASIPAPKLTTQPDPETEYNAFLQRARSGVAAEQDRTPVSSPPTTATPAFPSFEKIVPSPKPVAPPVSVPDPKPETVHVTNGVPATGVRPGSAGSSASSQRGSFFASYAPETATSTGKVGDHVGPEKDSLPPPPPYDKVVDQNLDRSGSANAHKQAEKAAKWFMSTTKKFAKVAAAKAKEVQQKLESNLQEHKQRRPPYRPEGLDMQHSSSNSGTNDYPDYYYDWATTLSGFNSADRQSVLLGMADDERHIVTNILKAQGIEVPLQSSTPASASSAGDPTQNPTISPSRPQTMPAAPSPEPAPQYSPPPVRHAPEEVPVQQPQQPVQRTAQAAPEAAADVSSQPSVESSDLLGMNSPRASMSPASSAPITSVTSDDLLGIHSPKANKTMSKAEVHMTAPKAEVIFANSTPPAPTVSTSSGPLDDLLGGAHQSASSSATTHGQADQFAAMFESRPVATGGAGGPMIGFDDDVGEEVASGHSHLYAHEQGEANEPPERKAARLRREAEKHRRMQEKLREKKLQEELEAAEKAKKVDLRDEYKPKIDAWSNQKKDNIRALLSTVDTVLWESSGWSRPGMTDLVDPQRVKRAYMKANLIVHPDKVKQKGGSIEQITVADMVFDVLKVAYAKFEESELRR